MVPFGLTPTATAFRLPAQAVRPYGRPLAYCPLRGVSMSDVDPDHLVDAFDTKLEDELMSAAGERKWQLEAVARSTVAPASDAHWETGRPSVDVEGVPLPPPHPTPPLDPAGRPMLDSAQWKQALAEWEAAMVAHETVSLRGSVVSRPAGTVGNKSQGGNDLLDAYFLMQAAGKCATVARLAIHQDPARRRNPIPLGTGFLIGPCMLMTCRHVLSEWLAGVASAEFDYVRTTDGKEMPTQVHRLNPKKFYVASPEKSRLDYAVVYVEPVSATGSTLLLRGWNPIPTPKQPKPGERVNIIQHPGGEHQQVALRDNQVIPCPRKHHMHYLADTLQYSSGSPVWDDHWNLVGLHHAGLARWIGRRGEILVERGGAVWNGVSPPVDDLEWRANEGVRIADIVSDLKQQVADTGRRTKRAPAEDGRLTRQELLDNCFKPPPSIEQLAAVNALLGLMGSPAEDDPDGVDLGRYDPTFAGPGTAPHPGGGERRPKPVVPKPPVDGDAAGKRMRGWAAFR